MTHLVKKAAKAKVKDPMACYNCLGLGHPDALCPFPVGAGEQSLRQSARIVADLVTTRQPARPEEGLMIPHRQPSATARARAKIKDGKTKAKAQEAPSGAKEHGEKERGTFLRLMVLNGSGLRPAHRMHSGHRAWQLHGQAHKQLSYSLGCRQRPRLHHGQVQASDTAPYASKHLPASSLSACAAENNGKITPRRLQRFQENLQRPGSGGF